MASETETKTDVVTPQQQVEDLLKETAEPEGFFLRVIKKLVAWVLLLCLVVLIVGFLFFCGLAIFRGILWLWPW